MLPNVFGSTNIPVLQEVLQFSQARHGVLVGNLANVNTPGYRTRDLSVNNFQTRLKEAIEASVPNVELTWRLGAKEIEQSKTYADHMLALKQIKRLPDFATFIDTSFVDAVKPT